MNYRDFDILFYGEKEIESEVEPYKYGNLISWRAEDAYGGYRVFRKRPYEKEWSVLTTLDREDVSFRDNKPPYDKTYEYKVEAIIEGDFVLEEKDGLSDFAITKDYQSPEQDMLNRMRTIKTDWRSHPNLGASLEELEGEPNTEDTGREAEDKVTEALTYDSRFRPHDLQVRAVPVHVNQIDIFSILESDDNEPLFVRRPLEL